MSTRFEVLLETPNHYCFALRSGDSVLLKGLSGPSKIMVQNEILHTRNALREKALLVAHRGDDGSHFVVLKDRDGTVLARSPHFKSEAELAACVAEIEAAVASAPVVDRTKHRHAV